MYYQILKTKKERHLKEGKLRLKASFEKQKKGTYHQTLLNMRVSDIENHFR